MVLKSRFILMGPALLLLASLAGAAEAPAPGEVVLPLKDYLALVEAGERAQKEAALRVASQEAPVAQVIEQQTVIRVEEGARTAEAAWRFEVLVQGRPVKPVPLPIQGFASEIEVRPAAPSGKGATVSALANGLALLAPEPGRYSVRISGQATFHGDGGAGQLLLAPVVAPVALAELDVPADLSWSAPKATIVEEKVAGGRRTVRLSIPRGAQQQVELRQRIDEAAEKLLARTVVLTILQLQPEGPRRHDVVLYEVSLGHLSTFAVDLPPGLTVEQAGTDEGTVIPIQEGQSLTVHRRKRLEGTGYLVLSSTPKPEGTLPLAPVVPRSQPRARYLALSSSVAGSAHPLPEASWTRVDLDDLPPMLREALAELDLSAAWRLSGPSAVETALAVSTLPPAPSVGTVVRLRETMTLVTPDGTVLHRDRLTLRSGSAGTAVNLMLPATATLWSAQVDNIPVRPVERGGTVSIPLGFESRDEPVVEVVSVLERVIPPGRSQLALDLAQIVPPVLEHRWRLFLPEGTQYRYRAGDLRPVILAPAAPRGGRVSASELEKVPTARNPWQVLQSTPGVLTDRINVGGNEAGQQSQYVGPGGRSALFGKVVDGQGQPLPGANVLLYGSWSSQPLIQVTDANGAFRFQALPGGRYTLQAAVEGFSVAERSDIDLSDGKISETQLTLTPGPAVMGIDGLVITDATAVGSAPGYYDFDSFEELKQGLVGGVKPLPVTIPESGKVLLMTGVLPPARVAVELDVKAKR
ncbi:MAG TPA: carboxypeptidase-like regulatory domain-containing protein [Thermoanaerobaculia bacterium]|nr:carboxypeptidase-like regulatory domain-containing protein [Thermoanaerobaculia bacterium]